MLIKVAFFACFVALSAAVPIIFKTTSARFHKHDHQDSWQRFRLFDSPNTNLKKEESYYLYPHYEFEYAVSDDKHGDHKRHYEHRIGDKVHGEYSLIEPGGSLRRVKYHADDENGFNAVVYRHASRHGPHGHAHSCIENTGYYHQHNHNPDTMHHPTNEHKEKPVNEKSEDTSETDNSIANQNNNKTLKETIEEELSSNKKQKASFSSLMLVGPPLKPPTPHEKDMGNDKKHGNEETASGVEQKPLENSVASTAEMMPFNNVVDLMEDSKDSQVAPSTYRLEYFHHA